MAPVLSCPVLSSSQSVFRLERSTADVVFGYRWLCAKARDKLLEVLQSFLDQPELRMIRLLLAATSLEPRLSTGDCHAFASTIGTPQGDILSPVLFTVYLEAALRDLRSRLPPRPPADDRLPLDVEYADDIDFISYSRPYLNDIERIVPSCLAEWSLHINAAKTERTSVSRQVDRAHEPWRTTRKLGSLLGDEKTWPAECNWQMSPSTKYGQFGSEGHRLTFFCDYGPIQHSS